MEARVSVPKNKKDQDLDRNDAGVDYRATDITRESNRIPHTASEKDCKTEDCDHEEGDLT